MLPQGRIQISIERDLFLLSPHTDMAWPAITYLQMT
ncbi:hypothetical protein VRRI112168_08920 [Vreelandella rituensis]